MKNSTFNELITIADYLDESGFKSEADEIDKIIKVAADQSRSVSSFIDALKKDLETISRVEGQFPSINEKSIEEIFKVIDYTLSSGGFQEHITYTSDQRFEDVAEKIAWEIVSAESEIEKSDFEMSQTDDKDEISRIQAHKDKNVENLKKNMELLQRMSSSDPSVSREKDAELAKRVHALMNKYREEIDARKLRQRAVV